MSDSCEPHRLSMGFPREECWSGLPFLPPGDLPNTGIEPESPELQIDSFPLIHQGKNSLDNAGDAAGDTSSIPWLGRTLGGRNGNPLQYSCLEKLMDRGGAWRATVHEATKSQTQQSS